MKHQGIMAKSITGLSGVLTETRRKYLCYAFLAVLVAWNTLLFTVSSFTAHTSLNTFGFDIGIMHHATWLISRFEDPFSTVNGLHFFAGHARFISVLVAPLMWLCDDARLLLFLQALVLSIGAIPLFGIARDKLDSRPIAICIVIAYLLYPALGYLNLENFHYNSFLTTIFLFAFWFLLREKFIAYFIFIALALATKEEAIPTVLLLGVFAAFKNPKVGAATVAAGLIYLVVVLKVVFPMFNPEGYMFFSRLSVTDIWRADPLSWQTYPEIWAVVEKNLFTAVNGEYLWKMLYPAGLLPLLSPPTLLLSGALYINLLSDWSYTHSIHYHYVAGVIPFIFISVVYGIALLQSSAARKAVPMVVAWLLFTSVVGSEVHGPNKTKLSRLGSFPAAFAKALPVEERFQGIAETIPQDATVSATYNLVPHLTARRVIFQFPNPFHRSYWGLSRDAAYTQIERVDYVILDTRRDQDYAAFDRLVEEGVYREIQADGPFKLYHHAPSQGGPGPGS